MKKTISILLCLALLMGALSGCGEKDSKAEEPPAGSSQEQTQEAGSAESGAPEGTESGESSEGGEAEPPEEEPEIDLLKEDLKDLIAGSWKYEGAEDVLPSLRFEFGEDGRYTAERDDEASGMTYSYSGAWDIVNEQIASQYDTVELPLLKLGLFSTDDPDFKQDSSLGDFIVDDKTVCDGSYMAYLI